MKTKPPIYFECPFCKAQPSERCTSKSGKVYSEYECHVNRKYLARKQPDNYDQAMTLLSKAMSYAKHKYTCATKDNKGLCSCGLIEFYDKYDMEVYFWQDDFCTHDKTDKKQGITFCITCKAIIW